MEERIHAMLFEEQPHHRAGLWSASSLGQCLRKQILGPKGIWFPMLPAMQRKYSLRSRAHELYQSGLAHAFGDIISEKMYRDAEYHVGGHVDAVLHKLSPPVLVEVKTFEDHPFRHYVNKPQLHYWNRQVDFYARRVAEDEGFADLVLQVHLLNIGTGEIAIVEGNREDYRPIAEALNIYWEADILPPRDEDCSKCHLKSACSEPFDTISEWVDFIKQQGGIVVEK